MAQPQEIPAQGPFKPNEVIDLVFLSQSPLGHLQHEIYNVVLAWAQTKLRMNPPDLDAAPDDIQNVFEFDLPTLAGLCNYGVRRAKGEGSKNIDHFLDAADGLRDRSVLLAGLDNLQADGYLNDRERRAALRARAPAESAPIESKQRGKSRRGTGDAKRGFMQLVSTLYHDPARNTVHVELPKFLCHRLLQSESTTPLETLLLPFTSRPACVLYELYLKHRNDGSLPRKDWPVWSRLLNGTGTPHKTYREFSKLFRRAVDQVNGHLTEHVLVPGERKGRDGRTVQELWVDLARKEQPGLELRQQATTSSAELLVKYGVTADAAAMLATKFPERVQRNVRYALEMHKKSPKAKLAAYIIDCVTNDYGNRGGGAVAQVSSRAPLQGVAPARPVKNLDVDRVDGSDLGALLGNVLPSAPGESPVSAAKDWIKSLDDVRQAALLAKFVEEAGVSQARFVTGAGLGLSKPAVLGPVSTWLAKREANGLGYPAV
jgi:hypothetical protein